MCVVRDSMEKNEQYARGWVRLYCEDILESSHMAQYALDLQKLRLLHEGTCPICQKELKCAVAH